jgi:hypothetical protein
MAGGMIVSVGLSAALAGYVMCSVAAIAIKS